MKRPVRIAAAIKEGFASETCRFRFDDHRWFMYSERISLRIWHRFKLALLRPAGRNVPVGPLGRLFVHPLLLLSPRRPRDVTRRGVDVNGDADTATRHALWVIPVGELIGLSICRKVALTALVH